MLRLPYKKHSNERYIIASTDSAFSIGRRKILRLYFPPAMLFYNT